MQLFEELENRTMLSYSPTDNVLVPNVTDVLVQRLSITLSQQQSAFTNTLNAKLNKLLSGSLDAWVFKTWIYNHRDSVNTSLDKMSQPNKGIITMLKDTITICPNWITDKNLNSAANGLIKDGIVKPFSKPSFLNNLKYVARLTPSQAVEFFNAVSITIFSGNDTTSWAADSWSSCLDDAQLNKVTSLSTLAKLLKTNKLLVVPSRTYAYFSWSGWPTKTIKLIPIVWTKQDRVNLADLLKNPTYSAMAQSALVAMDSGNMKV